MLVKLGSVWVDPKEVVPITKSGILTPYDMLPEPSGEDTYADIVNNALQTQSFGGEETLKSVWPSQNDT